MYEVLAFYLQITFIAQFSTIIDLILFKSSLPKGLFPTTIAQSTFSRPQSTLNPYVVIILITPAISPI